ncbi:hypothetical protein KFK09_013422 [Dendrobium nobile]|uniref:Uncharacterized protein n=1 Tax=Dendrobium nobile TaxID=94219 RepID=A0A8T3B762_DENNO|nr:hypothetical protein KFK09_013422 [Dendrobium nobile]
MASMKRDLGLVLLAFSFAWLLIGSGILRGASMAEATRVLKEERYFIKTRAGFVFESKPKGSEPGSGPSGCHHGTGGGSGKCTPNGVIEEHN